MKSNVKQIMLERSVSIRELAQLAGVAKETISKARDGSRIGACTLDMLCNIARALDCSVKDLFSEESADEHSD